MSFRRKTSSQSRCSCETRRESQRSRDDETCYGRKWEAAQGRNRGKRQKNLWTRRKGHRHFFQFWRSDGSGNWDGNGESYASRGVWLFISHRDYQTTIRWDFANDNKKVRFYTGFHAYDVLQTIIWIKASFILCECRTFANTTNLFAMICPCTL